MLIFFFFNDTATTEIYTLSLHDALPIWNGETRLPVFAWSPGTRGVCAGHAVDRVERARPGGGRSAVQDRKSTRLNSSHLVISYAVFCLKKKKRRPHRSSYFHARTCCACS